MADHITAHQEAHLTHRNLVRAYCTLVNLFAAHDVPATFAFVMAFLLEPHERQALGDRLFDVEVEGQNWLRHYRAAQERGDVDGWFCPEALAIVQSSPRHEIACHGFCHVPLNEGAIDRVSVIRELESAMLVAERKGLRLETFIYPRNRVGHLSELAAAGFKGFRARRGDLPLGRIGNLAIELDLFDRAQEPAGVEAGLQVIPPGYFLNWQRGLRRLVPRAASRMRWRSILTDAADKGRVAHVFLHPHNLIDGPGTLERLDDILTEAVRLRAQGRLEIITQVEYVRRQAEVRQH
jgi:peptidoglycan/xylan/chitin deacetylase (PgdA/CDA1 family)